MNHKKLTLVYFSPMGTTKKTLENIAKGLGERTIDHLDLTEFDLRWKRRAFSKDDLVLIGMPSYGGRIPSPAKEIFNRTVADGTLCIPVVTYGNRAYEDALIELKNNCVKVGFKPIAAAAFSCEHSYRNGVGKGRPDEEDKRLQEAFGRNIAQKLQELQSDDCVDIEVPGNYPYKRSMDIPIAPTVDSNKCVNCGQCEDGCPMKAIDPNNYAKVDNFRCVICFRCINNCPEKARQIEVPKFVLSMKMLGAKARGRKEAETFI